VTGQQGNSTAAALCACAATLVLGLSACGSSASNSTASTHTASADSSSFAKGAAASASASTAAGAPSPACAAAVAGALGGVGARIYHEAATGGDVEQAVHRVQSSPALAEALSSGDASRVHTALGPLLLNQIAAIEVLREGRVLARAGSGPAIAPVSGAIPGTGASFVLSVQAARSYARVASQVTGAQVLLFGRPGGSAPGERRGAHGSRARRLASTLAGPGPARPPGSGRLTYAGRSYEVVSLPGAVYPAGGLRIVLLVPIGVIACPGSITRARLETLGQVGERIYREELHSTQVSATLRLMESSGTFKRAVAEGNAAATREAIVGFFRAHIHVVRVRVSVGDRLLVDVGGPYVLAPVHGTLRSGGRVIGEFAMAIQDDAGYLKLAHLFTGAQVLMRVGSEQVMGTLTPGPARVPNRGRVSYAGHTYRAYSFTGEAFPSGPLRISLLIPG
jgi:hypothetical protein